MRYAAILTLLLLAACSNEQPPEPSEEIKQTLEKAEAVEQQLEDAKRATDEAVENASQ
ncbi:MAG: hypothetical protein AAF660_01090 [Pseudomonadota bacterium]